MLIQLQTTEKEVHALQNRLNELRKGSSTIAVSKDMLWKLLQDHYQMNTLLSRKHVTVEDKTNE